MAQPLEQEPHDFYDKQMEDVGALPIDAIEQIRKAAAVHDSNAQLNPLTTLLEARPEIDPNRELAEFKAAIDFEERDRGLQIKEDIIGLKRFLPGGHVETYDQKLAREEKRGEKEAASYGMGHVGENDVVLFATHWNFFAGTASVVVGEKFLRATELAARRKVPFIGWYSSAGVRQQENVAGLLQMTRMAQAIESYKSQTNQPYISVLSHQVWGGISASAVSLADVTVALKGTDYGFSGPRVIESYQQQKVPKGAQSAEANVLNRNLDVLVNDPRDLLAWMGGLLRTTQHHTREGHIEKPFFPDSMVTKRRGIEVFPERKVDADELYARYITHMKDATRPSTEFFLKHCFSEVVPLYSSVQMGDITINPSIIAAIGKIDQQPFLIVGTQPSYQRIGDRIVKIPASASPEDLAYRRRMLDFGARNKLPLVSFVDIPGAKPTLDAERAGQSREIAWNIAAGLSYPEPTITLISGLLGSGGGLSMAPWGDDVVMTEKALGCVAEPASATAILNNEANPSIDAVKATLSGMRATAYDQLELGLIDGVIPEEKNGGETIAESVRNHIVYAFNRLNGMNRRRRMELRDKKIRSLRIPLKNS